MQKFFFLFEKGAVASVDSQHSVRINPAQLGNFGGDIFQEVTIVTDDHTSEGGLLQQSLEPLNSAEIEMVRRLVEQEDIRRLNQGLDNRQALLPSAG